MKMGQYFHVARILVVSMYSWFEVLRSLKFGAIDLLKSILFILCNLVTVPN